jgi:hypothetical protein
MPALGFISLCLYLPSNVNTQAFIHAPSFRSSDGCSQHGGLTVILAEICAVFTTFIFYIFILSMVQYLPLQVYSYAADKGFPHFYGTGSSPHILESIVGPSPGGSWIQFIQSHLILYWCYWMSLKSAARKHSMHFMLCIRISFTQFFFLEIW